MFTTTAIKTMYNFINRMLDNGYVPYQEADRVRFVHSNGTKRTVILGKKYVKLFQKALLKSDDGCYELNGRILEKRMETQQPDYLKMREDNERAAIFN